MIITSVLFDHLRTYDNTIYFKAFIKKKKKTLYCISIYKTLIQPLYFHFKEVIADIEYKINRNFFWKDSF